MTKLSDERLAEMRETVADPDDWRELSMKDTREIALDLFDHIDALEAERAEGLTEVDRLKAENEQLHAELRHYRTGQRSVQP